MLSSSLLLLSFGLLIYWHDGSKVDGRSMDKSSLEAMGFVHVLSDDLISGAIWCSTGEDVLPQDLSAAAYRDPLLSALSGQRVYRYRNLSQFISLLASNKNNDSSRPSFPSDLKIRSAQKFFPSMELLGAVLMAGVGLLMVYRFVNRKS